MLSRRVLLTAALAVLAALALAACGSDSGQEGTSPDSADAADACETVAEPQPKQVDIEPPTDELAADSMSVATFETNCGSFQITLDTERAPKTAGSFSHLIQEGVYDGTPFHRIAPTFVIQGGDPLGSGQGDAGYEVVEAPPEDLVYTRGTVAMAKGANDEPGASGSQFFVVTGDDTGLGPEFALVGEVTDGFDTVDRIESLGMAGGDGPPSQPVVIESATLREG